MKKSKNNGNMAVFICALFVLMAVCYGIAQPIMVGEFSEWNGVWCMALAYFICRCVMIWRRNERRGWREAGEEGGEA